MRALLWLVAALLFLGAAAIVLFLVKGKPIALALPKLALADFVNIAILLVAVVSLFVAVVTYTDAKNAAVQQQAALDASRKALESVVQTATGQQTLLQKNLETLQAQLEVTQAQWRQEQERLARRAEISILSLNNRPWATIQEAQAHGNLSITIPAEGSQALTFSLRNIGQAALVHPIYIFTATPETVLVDERNVRVPRPDRNVLQISGANVIDFLPYSATRTDSNISADVTVPRSVSNFALRLRILGENMNGALEVNLNFNVVHQQ